MSKKVKVLIIVGGGIYGCIPAHFLSMLPEEDGRKPLEGVDCISGCSIGGILALAYASGASFRSLDRVFQERSSDCFCKRPIALINPLANPTYRGDKLDEVLEDILSTYRVKDIKSFYPNLDLVVPTLNITDDKYKVFNNIADDDLNVPLKDIAAFTSAAPSYFPGREYQGKCIIDGGLIEVAPLLTTVTALRSMRDIKFEDMDILMLGTGKDISDKPITYEKYERMTLLDLATDIIIPYVTFSNELATVYWGNHMGFNSFDYFNPCKHNGDLADVDAVPKCIEQCERFRPDFIETWYDWLTR